MDNKKIALLLHTIHTRGNINVLRHYNLSFREIAELIEIKIKEGLLKYENSMLMLSKKGLVFLNKNKDLFKINDKAKWIEPDYKNRIKQIDKDFIFLPSPYELSFLNELL